MKDQTGGLLTWLIFSWLGRFALAFALMIVGFVVQDHVDYESISYRIFGWTGWIGVAAIGVQTLIFIVYAWIINPMRERKELKDKK